MTVMTDIEHPPGAGPMTVRDLEGMPEDGRRHELIDGVLVVSPAPGFRHQKVVLLLSFALESARPPDLEVLTAPFAVHSGDSVELQPDVLVGRAEDFTDTDLPAPPVLAVEVLSPSTAIHDLNTKKAAYERLGVPSYWVIDPVAPAITVFEVDSDGCYQQVAKAAGAESYEALRPFPVRLVPDELLGGRLAG
ncbi:Uma2 family endonuclease [Amycolatopsis jiangsuensis]|uniref:Uma2 family endonuclease n=1 Tax=Amycolatopsis jiangsuensis TaxID=1181879 RepID=A0A840IM21_9PSEU|nr:Uma2 family endonuclease [Amycolatopsis jiangsuensis]MBB4682525.1 Uma2 family endonuclease [Amycolatopsis jiangsuensis]